MTAVSLPGDVELSFEQPADAAAAQVLRTLLATIEANLHGAIEEPGSEALHDLRVAVRRSRSVQRELKGAFPAVELTHFRKGFRWLQALTGPARDIDVYVQGFDQLRGLVPEAMREELEPLLDVLRGHRAQAREEMADGLRSERFTTLMSEWAELLELLPSMPVADRPDAKLPIGELTGNRIAKVYKRMMKMGARIGPESPPEAYHELRKKGKELRYLLELFGAPLYPSNVVKPMIKSLKGLQDMLGRHQDRQVQQAMLRSLSDELAAVPDGATTLMAVGALLASLGEDARATREEFGERFEAFASPKQRALVKETFGRP
ncbi:MAG TPA: CHAD domain-containing protein [Solirubrobacteraceae bacterium]